MKNDLNNDQYKLYDLIWKRLVASQMSNMVMEQVTIDITDKNELALARTTGSIIKFSGYYEVYKYDSSQSTDDNIFYLI